jgi:hypothetical protein
VEPAARDNVTGWFMYFCTTGTLLVPTPRCVGPECRGAKAGKTLNIGYAGDLDAGSRGSFTQAGRLIGLTAYDGVEIAKGLQELQNLQNEGAIDNYYAAAAKRAFAEKMQAGTDRPAPFQTPSALGAPLAPSALGRITRIGGGENVGPTVTEACRCEPREFDAIDNVSGWGIYYIGDGVLLTPSKKCVGGGGKPRSFWQQTWKNTISLFQPMPSAPVPPPPPAAAPAPAPIVPPPPTAPPPPPPPSYLCYDPRLWPALFRPQATPCVPPQIPWPE